MYTVSKIENIDEATFNSIYEANKEQLVANIGYDDVNHLRSTFKSTVDIPKIIFQAVDNDNNVVAYYVGLSQGNIAFMNNMITNASGTLALTVESSASVLKSLGYSHVDFCVKDGSSTETYCKNSMDRPELYEYLSETDFGHGYNKIHLRLL